MLYMGCFYHYPIKAPFCITDDLNKRIIEFYERYISNRKVSSASHAFLFL